MLVLVQLLLTIGSVNPSTQVNILAFGVDAADAANLRFMHNDGGTATKIDLGVDFPSRSTTTFYETRISCHPNGSDISYSIWNMTNNLYASGTISSKIPSNTQLLTVQVNVHNELSAIAPGLDVASIYTETNY